MIEHRLQEAASRNEESHDVCKSSTPISIISSHDRENIDDEDEILIETRNRTNQIEREENGEHRYHLREAFQNELCVEKKTDEESCGTKSSMIKHYCCSKYGAILGSFILGCGLTSVLIFQYILGLILLGAFGFLATIYLCWFCVMKKGHYCCNKFGACLSIFGALVFVASLCLAILWYNRYPIWHHRNLVPGIFGVLGVIGGLGLVTMYLCWMSMNKNSHSLSATDA